MASSDLTPWSKYRANRYRPTNNFRLPREILTKVHRAHYGTVGGLMVWGVDGEAVRNLVDIDFTTGGNPARYLYCPPNDLWVERWLAPNDFTSVVVHEYVEYVLMKNHGMTYDDAHDKAVLAEVPIRKRMRQGLLRIKSRAEGVRMVETLSADALR